MKKIISVIICAIFLIVPIFAAAANAAVVAVENDGIAGDINMDKKINNKDVVALFRYVSDPDSITVDVIAADCNGDGKSNSKDVVYLFRHVSGVPISITYGLVRLPDVNMTYVDADIYADKTTAEAEDFKKATANKLAEFFAEKIEYDETTWTVKLPAGFDNVDEFVIRKARGQYIEEVTVLRVAEGKNKNAVKSMAEFRCEKQKNNSDYTTYDDENHTNANMMIQGINAGTVAVINNFVIYAVTQDTNVSIMRARKFILENPGCSAAELFKAIVEEEYIPA